MRAAARLAAELDAAWHAVYVETPALQRLPEARRRAFSRVLKLAQDLGAQTATVSGTDTVASIVEYARTHNLGRIMLGRAAGRPSFGVALPSRSPRRASATSRPTSTCVVVSRAAVEPGDATGGRRASAQLAMAALRGSPSRSPR